LPDGLRILVAADVDPTTVIGGAERALAGQLNELMLRGHQITVMTRQQQGLPAEERTPEGYNIVRYPMPPGMNALDLTRALRTIRAAAERVISAENPDVIYIQQPLVGAGLMLGSRGRKLPCAYQFHSPWSDEYRLRLPRASRNVSDPESLRLTSGEKIKFYIRKALEGKTIRHANRILVLSEFMRGRCMRLHSVPKSGFAIVPGGVDTEHFHDYSNRALIRSRLQIGDGERMLLSVRNLEPRMGLANLIAAMPSILTTSPNTVCIIGGSGAMAEELKSQADALHLDDRVRFAGFIPESELPEYYAAADLFVLPTTALEGFGMVTIEALACGTPVCGTPIGATPEILSGLNSELLLSGVEPEQIARGCLAVLNQPEVERKLLRSKCRAFAVDNYSWPAVVNGVESVLREIVN
jgi:glycosyltransferase involved in cell wall biosynthesis